MEFDTEQNPAVRFVWSRNCFRAGVSARGIKYSLRGRRTKGREGGVECEREARSMGSRKDPYEIPKIALRVLVALRARIQLLPSLNLRSGVLFSEERESIATRESTGEM